MLTKVAVRGLVIPFGHKVEELIANCQARGVNLRVIYGTRHPRIQAALWAQSRSEEEISTAIATLSEKAPTIVQYIKEAEPLCGRWATNLLPGQSWHQWGEAVDCCILNTVGQAVWASQHPGYSIYAEEAIRLGLTSGALWRSKDSVHVQMRKESVRDIFSWEKIDSAMKSRFAFC